MFNINFVVKNILSIKNLQLSTPYQKNIPSIKFTLPTHILTITSKSFTRDVIRRGCSTWNRLKTWSRPLKIVGGAVTGTGGPCPPFSPYCCVICLLKHSLHTCEKNCVYMFQILRILLITRIKVSYVEMKRKIVTQ